MGLVQVADDLLETDVLVEIELGGAKCLAFQAERGQSREHFGRRDRGAVGEIKDGMRRPEQDSPPGKSANRERMVSGGLRLLCVHPGGQAKFQASWDTPDSSNSSSLRKHTRRMSWPIHRPDHDDKERIQKPLEDLAGNFAVAIGGFSVMGNQPDGLSHSVTRS